MADTSIPPGVPKKRSVGLWLVMALVPLLAGGWFLVGMSNGEPPPEVNAAVGGVTASDSESSAAAPEHAPPPPPVAEEETVDDADVDETAETAKPREVVKAASGPTKHICSSPCEGESNGAFKAALRQRAQLAQVCYFAALRQDETLQGKLTVTLRVAPSGRACSVGITNDTMGSASVSNCIKKRFQDATYPPPRGGCVDAAVPLNMVAKQ